MNNRLISIGIRLLMLLVALVILDSCKAKKEIVPVSENILRSPRRIVSAMHENQVAYDFLNTRFSGSALIGNQNYNISGTIRIHKDEAIYISITPLLGIEVARALITPDTVKVMNRMESSYFVGDMEFINKLLNTRMDYYMLQAILTGNDFDHFSSSNFKVFEEQGKLMLHSAARGSNHDRLEPNAFEHRLWLDENTLRIRQTTLHQPQTRQRVKADYSGFTDLDGQLLPTEVSLEFTSPSDTAVFSLRYHRTSLNEPQQMSFSIPARYVPMNF